MSLLLWIILLPAISAAVLLVVGGRFADRWGHLLGTATPLASFVLGVLAFLDLQGSSRSALREHVFTWIDVQRFHVAFNLLFDPLSALFVLLITGVGSLIHIYSIGYMAHDDRRRRFFAYLNLFVAAMLTLVLTSDYLALFLGWEGVGLASYLLIGFWQAKPSAAVAAKKAFLVNRVGDVGMSLAIMLMFASFGTMSFAGVAAGMPHASTGLATVLGLLLLLGACGKSAQVPLQSWLLDAMEGPTPVSALIHAATMTAVAVVGAVTLLWGAVIGCAKDDIKKALAGSTMSQIGYMMLAAGIGPAGYAFAIFHLLTHGFFKANLFLGAGSVMHATNDNVDMRRYGALRKALPITFVTFACGYLAIIGFPGFAGFWSKDRIIEAAFNDNAYIGLAALVGAGITAFYMTRVMIMTFFGEKRWEADVHPHEAPLVMTVPLMILAALSAVGGALLINDWIVTWLTPVVGAHEPANPALSPWLLTILVLLFVAAGIAVAVLMYQRERVPEVAPARVSLLTEAARANLYGDALNEAAFMRPGQRLTESLVHLDGGGLDGTVNGVAAVVGGISARFRRWQTGFVRTYALSMLGGSAIIVLALLVVRLG
jgi:NADH-quinone oxidoreductase subunit L